MTFMEGKGKTAKIAKAKPIIRICSAARDCMPNANAGSSCFISHDEATAAYADAGLL